MAIPVWPTIRWRLLIIKKKKKDHCHFLKVIYFQKIAPNSSSTERRKSFNALCLMLLYLIWPIRYGLKKMMWWKRRMVFRKCPGAKILAFRFKNQMYVIVSAFTNYANTKAMQKYTNVKCQKTLFVCLDKLGFHRTVIRQTKHKFRLERILRWWKIST